MEDLLLFVAKSYMFISIVESQSLRHLIMHQNPQVMFRNQKQMVQHPSLHWWSKLWNDMLSQLWILVL